MKRRFSDYVGAAYRSAKRYIPAVAGAVASKYAYSSGGSRTNVRRRRRRGGVLTTNQYDKKVQYVKKRMPYRKRKRWVKFTKKVRAVLEKTLGTNTQILNSTLASTIAAGSDNQNWMVLHLYGRNGNSTPNVELGCNDLNYMISNDTRIGSNIIFKSAVLDATLVNSGSIGLEVDVYQIMYRDETKYLNFGGILATALGGTGVIGTSGTNINLSTRGATLFDLPVLIKMGKITILKKTKIFLPAGNTSTFQMRDAKQYKIDKTNTVSDSDGYLMNPLTQSVVIVYKKLAGQSATAAALTVGCTRKYSYCINEDDSDRANSF